MFVLRSVSGEAIARSRPDETSARGFVRRLLADRPARLDGADFGDLLTQARLAGDANSITADGRLNLGGTGFGGASLRGASARRVHMPDADLSGCDLSDADFEEAVLPGARLRGSILSGARFCRADMRRAVMSPFELSGTSRSLHDVRSKADAWLYTRKTVAAGAKFDGADMRQAVITDAVLRGAGLAGTNLARARVERCDLDDARFSGTVMTGATFVRNSMVSASVHGAVTDRAVMRTNTYVAWPQPASLFTSRGDALRRLADFVRNEREHLALMPQEMRADSLRSIAVQGAVMVAASVAARSLYMCLAGSPLADGLIASGLVGAIALHKELGAIVNNVAAPVIKSVAHEAVSRATAAVSGFRIDGFRGAWGALVATGHLADKLASRLDGHPSSADHYAFTCPGLTVVIDHIDHLNSLLCRLNMADPDGGLVIEREAGGHLPDSTAPWRVQVDASGAAVATWRHMDGSLAKSVRYAPDGSPTGSLDHAAGAADFAPIAEERFPSLRRRRAVLEEIKDAAVRAAVAYDGQTHIAHLTGSGTIVIRSAGTGAADNPHGQALGPRAGHAAVLGSGRRVGARGQCVGRDDCGGHDICPAGDESAALAEACCP